MRLRLSRICTYGVGVMTMLIAIQRHLLAGAPNAAPEIDTSLLSAAVAVVAAGALILRSRRRSK